MTRIFCGKPSSNSLNQRHWYEERKLQTWSITAVIATRFPAWIDDADVKFCWYPFSQIELHISALFILHLNVAWRRKESLSVFGWIDGHCVFEHHLFYKIAHLLWPLWGFFCIKAARVACSNTSRTPSPSFAEHSKYLYAPIFWATAIPYFTPLSNHTLGISAA